MNIGKIDEIKGKIFTLYAKFKDFFWV